jgi:superoxide dismutase, Fe-Mn family
MGRSAALGAPRKQETRMQGISRRGIVRGAAVTAAAISISKPYLAFGQAAGPFTQPPLPYKEDALAPTISAQTVALHYGKHHKAYFDNLNKLVAGTPYATMQLEEVMKASVGKPEDVRIFNNAGQAWNHILYWEQFKPGGGKAPSGKLAAAIDKDLGGFQACKDKLAEVATGVFGSGWGWLVQDGDKLTIVGTQNGDNPNAHGKRALLGIDVWEHAYYLDYQNRRADHVKAALEHLVNWDYVRDRMA